MTTTTENKRLRWGILASGAIARQFAEGVSHSETGELVAVGSRSQQSADRFAEQFPAIRNRHAGYDALLADPEVDAIYVATPHPLHREWATRAIAAGKHVLCEKPIGMNLAEARMIVDAARAADVFLMEGYMYRCSPQTAKIVELVKSGALGEIKAIEASFSFDIGDSPEGRHLNKELGGGGILDVGGYPVSFARLIAGVAHGKPFENPEQLKAVGHLGPTGVDEYTSAVLQFPGGIVARADCGVHLEGEMRAAIHGSRGRLIVPEPWKPAQMSGSSQMLLYRLGEESPETIRVETNAYLYGAEADTVARFLDSRQAESPAMSWDDTLGLMADLDRWRAEIGLRYAVDDETQVS